MTNKPPGQKNQDIPYDRNKMGRENVLLGQDTSLCLHIEKVRESMFEIHDQCSNQCSNTLKSF